jgi:hypothetical protein
MTAHNAPAQRTRQDKDTMSLLRGWRWDGSRSCRVPATAADFNPQIAVLAMNVDQSKACTSSSGTPTSYLYIYSLDAQSGDYTPSLDATYNPCLGFNATTLFTGLGNLSNFYDVIAKSGVYRGWNTAPPAAGRRPAEPFGSGRHAADPARILPQPAVRDSPARRRHTSTTSRRADRRACRGQLLRPAVGLHRAVQHHDAELQPIEQHPNDQLLAGPHELGQRRGQAGYSGRRLGARHDLAEHGADARERRIDAVRYLPRQ